MELFWLVISGLFILIGIAGCFLPFLPGPPLSYVGLLTMQLRQSPSFSTSFLVTWAVIVTVVTLLDYVVPMFGTRRFGGTKYGIWGCAIGLIVGFWFGPAGIFLGPFVGALVGEWISSQNSHQAMRAALGSFIGFMVGTVIKLIACVTMLYYFIVAI